MKKIILFILLIGISYGVSAQLRYNPGSKIYIDAGVQVTYEGGPKISVGRKLGDKFGLGLSLSKAMDSGLTSLGIDGRYIFRNPSRTSGFILHGGLFTAVIPGYYYQSLTYPEFGLGGIFNNISVTIGAKIYNAKTPYGSYREPWFTLQSMYHFGSIDPKLREKRSTRYRLTEEELRAKRNARLERPVYFDVALGFAIQQGNIPRMYSPSDFYYNIAIGWQKTPWLGFGLNYTNFGAPDYDAFKSLGVSWRARPRFGYLKATLNLLSEFEDMSYSYTNNINTNIDYKKTRIPPSLSLEAGVRCWDMFLIKAGYLFQAPFEMEVTTRTTDYTGIGQVNTKVVENQRIQLGYFHMGIGFVL